MLFMKNNMNLLTWLTLLGFSLFFSSPTTAESISVGIAEAAVYDPATKSRNKLVLQAAKLLDIKINFSEAPAKRSLKLVSEGVLDAEIGRHNIIESMYPSLVRVDEPIGYLDYWVWVPENSECMTNRNELSNYKPIGMNGVYFYDQLVYPLSKIGFEKVKQTNQLVLMLFRGRADYTVHSKEVLTLPIYTKYGRLKSCLKNPLFTLNFYLYLHKSKKHLKTDFERALRVIKYGY